MSAAQRLQGLLLGDGIVVAPGVYDGLSARIATAAGFSALYCCGGADTGYGNALNVVRTVREFERLGADGEDVV